jgi:hypothetical protein
MPKLHFHGYDSLRVYEPISPTLEQRPMATVQLDLNEDILILLRQQDPSI